jgi:hypothetical protein
MKTNLCEVCWNPAVELKHYRGCFWCLKCLEHFLKSKEDKKEQKEGSKKELGSDRSFE